MVSKVAFVFFLAVAAGAFALEMHKCKGGEPLPKDLYVRNCVEEPCPFYRGEYGGGDITFEVPYDLDTMNIQVMATALGVDVEFPVPDPDVCNNLENGGECPLTEGAIVTYNLTIPVLKAYPKIPLILELRFRDEEEILVCVSVNCIVKDR